ncbi:hypothetical protein [Polaribacter sp. R77954]|uniref:hypothetical protein n=1 Tax=Polaribacter sp. R77954 TaxID=3093870 RepID=UPI0037C76BD2
MDHYNKYATNANKNSKKDLNTRNSSFNKKHRKKPIAITKSDWVRKSYGFLFLMLILVLFFSHQKIFHFDYGITLGNFNKNYSSFDYTVQEKKYSRFIEIGQPSTTTTTNYNKVGRKSPSFGKPFRYQLINYVSADPTKTYFMLSGLSNGSQDYTILSNWTVIILIVLIILNYFFTKFAYRKGWEAHQRKVIKNWRTK